MWFPASDKHWQGREDPNRRAVYSRSSPNKTPHARSWRSECWLSFNVIFLIRISGVTSFKECCLTRRPADRWWTLKDGFAAKCEFRSLRLRRWNMDEFGFGSSSLPAWSLHAAGRKIRAGAGVFRWSGDKARFVSAVKTKRWFVFKG